MFFLLHSSPEKKKKKNSPENQASYSRLANGEHPNYWPDSSCWEQNKRGTPNKKGRRARGGGEGRIQPTHPLTLTFPNLPSFSMTFTSAYLLSTKKTAWSQDWNVDLLLADTSNIISTVKKYRHFKIYVKIVKLLLWTVAH